MNLLIYEKCLICLYEFAFQWSNWTYFTHCSSVSFVSWLRSSKYPLIMVLWGLLLQIISHFCFLRLSSTKKYYLSWSIHDEFINLEGISSLSHRIYLLLRFFVKFVWFWVIFNVKLSIWEWRINLYFGNHWQIDFISNHFSEKFQLVFLRVNVYMTNYNFLRDF